MGETKSRTNVEAKPALTEDSLKTLINKQYQSTNANYKIVKEAVDSMTERLQKPIKDLIGFTDDSLELVITMGQDGKKNYQMQFNLSDEELEFLAIKIPAVCVQVQEYLNDRQLDASISEYMFEDAVTENLKTILGGDAKERMRFAVQQAEMQNLVTIIKKQVLANLKTYIDRADKVYEGVKKVIDGKNKERLYNNQYSKHSA